MEAAAKPTGMYLRRLTEKYWNDSKTSVEKPAKNPMYSMTGDQKSCQ
jgi:hypothetical protein